MQISLSVPYDAHLSRRTLRFLARPQLRLIRVLGGVIMLAGLLALVLDPADLIAYATIVFGTAVVFGITPLTVAYSMRMQSDAILQGCHMTLDDDGLHVSYPLVESRIRWAAVSRIVETPEVWYMVFGKQHALTVPKYPMTPQQQAEFAAFLAPLRPTAAR